MLTAAGSAAPGLWRLVQSGLALAITFGAWKLMPDDGLPVRTCLIPGWSGRRILAVSVALTFGTAAFDAALGPNLVLIGLLIVGPCSALLSGRLVPTAAMGAAAIGLAVVLGLPDGIWGMTEHVVFIAAVCCVTLVATVVAALIQRLGER